MPYYLGGDFVEMMKVESKCGAKTPRLANDPSVSFVVETHDQRLALAERRRAEVAGRAEQQLLERGGLRLVLFHVEMNDVLPFGGVDVVDLLGQLQRLFFFERRLFSVDLFGRFDAGIRKKLLRLSAGRSARAVVAPVEFGHCRTPLQTVGEKKFTCR